MAYSVKLKNQSGTDVNYSAVEHVAIPLATGAGDATFVARYKVTKNDLSREKMITFYGGEYAANGVDYMCRISIPADASASIQGGIGEGEETILIGGVEPSPDAYEYNLISAVTDYEDGEVVSESYTEAILKIKGEYITGDIVLSFGIVS